MRAFIYARVSTHEQDGGMQFSEGEEFAARRGWQVVEKFADVTTGAKERRPGLDNMLSQVRRRKCDVVIVYKFDRFARSLRFLVNTLEEFDALGVKFVSLHDEFDLTTPMGRCMFQMAAAFAELERAILRERTRSGVAHARAKGKRLGRPPAEPDQPKIDRLRALGRPWREISKTVGLGESTLRRLRSKTSRNSNIASR